MGEKTNTFHEEIQKAILPSLRWTGEDKRSFWSLPISKWGDFFALRKAKHKMMRMYAKHRQLREMPKLVPLYIKAVRKGHVLTLDYLQNYGDLILSHFVQNYFRRKYGFSSKQWEAFLDKEGKVWEQVVALRRRRQEKFFEEQIMKLEKIPEKIRRKIIQNTPQPKIRKALTSYFHYQDGEDRTGKKLPPGLKPSPTSLVILENQEKKQKTDPKEETKKEKKPLPPIFFEKNGR